MTSTDHVLPPLARAGVFDLRQYTLKPGRRDDLVDLFDGHLVAGQEDVGMHVLGQFRDLDAPDRFVWLRAFDSLPARAEALAAFYYGPVWRAHRDAANDTMLDSDDALLLRPVHLGPRYPAFGTRGAPRARESVIGITVEYRNRPVGDPDVRLLVDEVLPVVAATGAEVVAAFATEPAENNFPALPLRDENVLVWVVRCADDGALGRHREALATSPVEARLSVGRRHPPQRLRLRATAASHLG
jgi:hypothetical protein